MDEDRLVHAMVSNSLEKYSSSQQRYLERIDINVDAVVVPGVGSNSVGEEGCEEPIEV